MRKERRLSDDERAGGVVFRELSYFHFWIYVLVLALILLYGVVCIRLIGLREFRRSITYFGVLAVIVVTFANFFRLVFEINKDEVRFRFGVIGKRFPIEELEDCSPFRISFFNYLGYGIRFGLDGTTAYNTRGGPGVKLVFRSAKRPYVVSVRDPERVCSLLAGMKCSSGERRGD